MRVKGISLKVTLDFVKHNYPDRLEEWISSLSELSRESYSKPLMISDWYPIEITLESRKKIAELFFNGDYHKCAWEIGRFSADSVLKGIYKAFIKVASTSFVIGRASKILAAYYENSELEVLESTPKSVNIKINNFPASDSMFELSLCGWIEFALEKVGSKEIEIKKICSISDGDPFSEYHITWI
jgi:hypothetical protein